MKIIRTTIMDYSLDLDIDLVFVNPYFYQFLGYELWNRRVCAGSFRFYCYNQTVIQWHKVSHLVKHISNVNLNETCRFMNKLAQEGGERLATFMIYLSGTKKDIGGSTVFPQLGISVKPQRGAALYWHNVKSDGTFDTRSSHLGKPWKPSSLEPVKLMGVQINCYVI